MKHGDDDAGLPKEAAERAQAESAAVFCSPTDRPAWRAAAAAACEATAAACRTTGGSGAAFGLGD